MILPILRFSVIRSPPTAEKREFQTEMTGIAGENARPQPRDRDSNALPRRFTGSRGGIFYVNQPAYNLAKNYLLSLESVLVVASFIWYPWVRPCEKISFLGDLILLYMTICPDGGQT